MQGPAREGRPGLGGEAPMELTWTGGARALPEEQDWNDPVELIAAEFNQPLSVIRQSAEELANQLREACSDPTDISAAEDLAQSAERMSRMVHALIQASREGVF
jgi:signal transduction histidine kinase